MIVTALLAGVVAGFASAGISRAGVPEVALEHQVQSPSVEAVRAVITRCLPSIGEAGKVVTSGLDRLPSQDEEAILGQRKGRVFIRGESYLLIDFDDAPVCRVVALSVDPAVLADLVLQVFAAAEDTFQPQRFRVSEDGGFVAVFRAVGAVEGVQVRITTTRQRNGNVFASLNVERSASGQN